MGKQMWYIHTMEYDSTFKRKEILTYATTWTNFKSNKSDVKGQILYDPTYIRYLEQSNSQRQKVQQWLPAVMENELLFLGLKGFAGDDEKVLWLDGSEGCTTMLIISCH